MYFGRGIYVKYMLGTFLAIYDICLDIGIDLNDEDFLQKLLNAMDEYISTKEIDYKKII